MENILGVHDHLPLETTRWQMREPSGTSEPEEKQAGMDVPNCLWPASWLGANYFSLKLFCHLGSKGIIRNFGPLWLKILLPYKICPKYVIIFLPFHSPRPFLPVRWESNGESSLDSNHGLQWRFQRIPVSGVVSHLCILNEVSLAWMKNHSSE